MEQTPCSVDAAINEAKASGKPSLIEVKTVIGYGSPNKQGTNAVHGAPLGAEEAEATRKALGWDYAPFEIPEEVYADYRTNVAERGAAAYDAWKQLVDDYKQAHPELAAEVTAIIAGQDPVEIKPKTSQCLKMASLKQPVIPVRMHSMQQLRCFQLSSAVLLTWLIPI